MKRLIIFGALVGFFVWRSRQLEAADRANGLGPYARFAPVVDP